MGDFPRVSWQQTRDESPLRLASRRLTEKVTPLSERIMDLVAPTTRTIPEAITRALPLTSEAWSVDDIKNALKEGNVGQAALIGGLSMLPLGGYLTAAARRGAASVPSRFGQSGQIVWHGSPHKFDKFDMSKVGTGEGAQAYGHGLYFAESPEVGQTYANTLSDSLFRVDGNQVKSNQARDILYKKYEKKYSGSEDISIGDVVDHVLNDIAYAKDSTKYLAGPAERKLYDEIFKDVSQIKSGQLYKVDIPDETVARFLDWDKPLSQQGDLLKRTGPHGDYYTLRDHLDRLGIDENATGKDLLQEMGYGRGGDKARAISEYLTQWGLPGIKYLDRGSRQGSNFGKESGTSNFVLFSDDLPRIIERNGEATGLHPWKPGEWEGGLKKYQQGGRVTKEQLDNPDTQFQLEKYLTEQEELKRQLEETQRRRNNQQRPLPQPEPLPLNTTHPNHIQTNKASGGLVALKSRR